VLVFSSKPIFARFTALKLALWDGLSQADEARLCDDVEEIPWHYHRLTTAKFFLMLVVTIKNYSGFSRYVSHA